MEAIIEECKSEENKPEENKPEDSKFIKKTGKGVKSDECQQLKNMKWIKR